MPSDAPMKMDGAYSPPCEVRQSWRGGWWLGFRTVGHKCSANHGMVDFLHRQVGVERR